MRNMTDHGMTPALALDITVLDPIDGKLGDFSVKGKRQRALDPIREQKPLFLIGSPTCTAYTT